MEQNEGQRGQTAAAQATALLLSRPSLPSERQHSSFNPNLIWLQQQQSRLLTGRAGRPASQPASQRQAVGPVLPQPSDRAVVEYRLTAVIIPASKHSPAGWRAYRCRAGSHSLPTCSTAANLFSTSSINKPAPPLLYSRAGLGQTAESLHMEARDGWAAGIQVTWLEAPTPPHHGSPTHKKIIFFIRRTAA